MIDNKSAKFSESRQCGHCGNYSTMKIVAEFRDVTHPHPDDEYPFSEGKVYRLLQCPAHGCKNVELESYSYSDAVDFGERPDFDYETLFPVAPQIPPGLPRKVQDEYEAALKEKRRSPNAYGVLLGRVLERVCDDKGATGKMLGQKLDSLSEVKDFPLHLAFPLNEFRVIAAHAALGKLTAKEVPIIENLIRAILESLYSAPYLVRQAQKAIKKIKKDK
ncbi:MAG TPA: DUF4145 domain-containing protein [Verrucomicrobiae bacterium]|nr:DUF4145 domain-containing protein [Verrucomicrobiae bacterium]